MLQVKRSAYPGIRTAFPYRVPGFRQKETTVMDRREAVQKILGVAGLTLLGTTPMGWACRATMEPDTTRKDHATAGDTGVITITIRNTHRNCKIPIDKTRFSADNMKIVAATSWKETGKGQFERKLKVIFGKKGTAKLDVIRSCPRGGCRQKQTFEVSRDRKSVV